MAFSISPQTARRVLAHALVPVVLLAVIVRPNGASAQQAQPTKPADVHEHVAVTAPLLTPTREALGTAWLPPVTPMYGVHRPWGGWDVRLSGVLFLQALYEPAIATELAVRAAVKGEASTGGCLRPGAVSREDGLVSARC